MITTLTKTQLLMNGILVGLTVFVGFEVGLREVGMAEAVGFDVGAIVGT